MKSEDTEVLGGLRATPNEIKARSNTVEFNVPHIIGHIGDDFYGSDDPTNSVKH